jgi:DNA-binding response OmpR family regulator
MPRVLIVAREGERVKILKAVLEERGFDCAVLSASVEAVNRLVVAQPPHVVLFTTEAMDPTTAFGIREQHDIPLIVLLSPQDIDTVEQLADVDDFVFPPWEGREVIMRIGRIVKRREGASAKELIRCGDLVIDLARCKVVLGDKPVVLTFKEYQLLKFLAGNKGKVFTREDLLKKIWGWEYCGGDRTVDVHIRRLRSKIEDSKHCFIETVRNVGYRFSEP